MIFYKMKQIIPVLLAGFLLCGCTVLEKKQQAVRRLVFCIGGPYGFAPAVYDRADEKLSLSKMTFSHQMVRLIFTEAVYRACTIMKGEPYHHE